MYKKKISFDDRLKSSNAIINKYPGNVPIICEHCTTFEYKKFLVGPCVTMAHLHAIIRKQLTIGYGQAIFVLVNGRMFASNSLLHSIYNQYKDPDGFLYITYYFENTFGSLP